jgi:HME family heavy-metal exporter
MEGLPGVTDLQVERQTLVPQVRIRVQPDRAARYGFRVGELVDVLQTVTAGKAVSQVLDGVRSYDLVLTLDDAWRSDSGHSIGDVRILSPSGAVALISDVADIYEIPGPNEIARENAQRRIVVSCNVQGGGEADLGSTVAAIERSVTAEVFPQLPPGYSIAFEGQHQAQQRATRAILLLSACSLTLMFAVLFAYFGSWIMAAQVMLNIPMAFIGAVAALAIAGEPFSVASLIGFVSLCGIASRNGLLMISHYIHLMKVERMPFGAEMVIRGSQERVAPVLMTALTTGLAMIPLLLNPDAPGKEILYPVAIVVTGGLVSCTILDFLVTPTVFLAFARRAAERLALRTTLKNDSPVQGAH